MAIDYLELQNDINSTLTELGSAFEFIVPGKATISSTGKKIYTESISKTGIGVRGTYDSKYITKDSVVQAGDVKFVCQFDDSSFEPVDKSNCRVNYCGTSYTVVNVGIVAPSGEVIAYLLQLRRV